MSSLSSANSSTVLRLKRLETSLGERDCRVAISLFFCPALACKPTSRAKRQLLIPKCWFELIEAVRHCSGVRPAIILQESLASARNAGEHVPTEASRTLPNFVMYCPLNLSPKTSSAGWTVKSSGMDFNPFFSSDLPIASNLSWLGKSNEPR